MLIVFGGLPGTGKTTLARALAAELRAAYVRIDAVESAMRRAGVPAEPIETGAGYVVAHDVAKGSLAAGATVVIDAVNALEIVRRPWRELAHRLDVSLRVIETICSDEREHRRRVEERQSDIDGLQVPTWADVLEREYERWSELHLVVDTCEPHDRCLARIREYVAT